MTLLSSAGAPLAAQAEREPAGAPGRWEWLPVESQPDRRFRLFVPDGVAEDRAAPLVVMLHGCTQDPDDLARGTRFGVAAAARGVIVAYPEQPASAHPQKCWNWYLPEHQARDAGEPALVAAIARQVMARHRVDPARVFVAGISAGGSMALNAAAAYPELFAAVGAHSAIPLGAARDVPSALAAMRGAPLPLAALVAAASRGMLEGRPPALIAIQGEADAVVSPLNLPAVFVQWSALHGAGTAHDDSLELGGRSAVRTRHLGADGSFQVEVWRVDGLGHAWSGGSREGTFADPAGPEASRLMLEFFLEHGRR